MSEDYYTTPKCKKCGHIQREYVMVSDDYDFPSSFSCEECGASHTIAPHMEFDIELKNENESRIR